MAGSLQGPGPGEFKGTDLRGGLKIGFLDGTEEGRYSLSTEKFTSQLWR